MGASSGTAAEYCSAAPRAALRHIGVLGRGVHQDSSHAPSPEATRNRPEQHLATQAWEGRQEATGRESGIVARAPLRPGQRSMSAAYHSLDTWLPPCPSYTPKKAASAYPVPAFPTRTSCASSCVCLQPCMPQTTHRRSVCASSPTLMAQAVSGLRWNGALAAGALGEDEHRPMSL